MNLKQLQHLLTLAETGSFVSAAEKCFLTQSAFSRSIQAMEKELGGPLVDRLGKHNDLTALGRDVVQHAHRVLHEAAVLRESAQRVQQGVAGVLRVGLSAGTGVLLTTPLLRFAAERHPHVRLQITRGPMDYQFALLRKRALDVLMADMRLIVPAADLVVERLTTLRAGFICRSGHPLTRCSTVALPDMLAYPIASTHLSDEVARRLVERFGPAANPEQMLSLRCDDIGSLLELVVTSDAIFVGIVAAAARQCAAGHLTELQVRPTLDTHGQFGYVTLAGHSESPLMGLLRDFVNAQLQVLSRDST